ncbi:MULTISPECIES: ABC transporter permease [Paenibacillus]|nr:MULTISPECIES: ABC transporter permease subunit [Paenibacillus]MEC0230415.1 ABC transporter permease subunit [Paenibacillus alba]NQX69412.1 sugar ABC transporter permease [Paenibacillus alba]
MMGNSIRVLTNDLKKNRAIYLMVLPVVLYFFIFKYFPMYGAVIAFKDFSPAKGIWGSDWVGFVHFKDFFQSYYFLRVLRNTFLISFYQLVFGFPAPIILALLLNEIRQKLFKSIIQTVSYLPHFISIVVISGLIIDFTNRGGIANSIITFFGGQDTALLNDAGNFRSIFVSTSVWQELGWSSIIYLAALSGINPELYEASRVDGAGRFRQIWSVTLPGLIPTIMILLILRIGGLMEVGFEKIVLLYNPNTYETADVISSFVYREGLAQGNDYSYTTAVGLFQSMINFILLISANSISRRFSGSRLW